MSHHNYDRARRCVVASRAAAAASPYLLRDTFTDADGTALASHTMTVGGGWTVHAGAADIQGNKARRVIGDLLATSDAGTADATVAATLRTGAVDVSLLARYVDTSNYWAAQLDMNVGRIVLYSVIAGGFANRGEYVGSYTTGVDYLVSVTCTGNSWSVSVDGVERITATNAAFNTATRFGLNTFGNLSQATWDDFIVVAA